MKDTVKLPVYGKNNEVIGLFNIDKKYFDQLSSQSAFIPIMSEGKNGKKYITELKISYKIIEYAIQLAKKELLKEGEIKPLAQRIYDNVNRIVHTGTNQINDTNGFTLKSEIEMTEDELNSFMNDHPELEVEEDDTEEGFDQDDLDGEQSINPTNNLPQLESPAMPELDTPQPEMDAETQVPKTESTPTPEQNAEEKIKEMLDQMNGVVDEKTAEKEAKEDEAKLGEEILTGEEQKLIEHLRKSYNLPPIKAGKDVIEGEVVN